MKGVALLDVAHGVVDLRADVFGFGPIQQEIEPRVGREVEDALSQMDTEKADQDKEQGGEKPSPEQQKMQMEMAMQGRTIVVMVMGMQLQAKRGSNGESANHKQRHPH